ncbi:MAG TPA: ABC transporter ATP-binding protein [Bordetella sp.]|nr:ABC transporter ATP-binding protein [Bordetella sp.]
MGTIAVKNVGKAYKEYRNRWHRLAEWVLPGTRKYHGLKWVLQDIDFSVAPGEAVGIIGFNGAGKSTLLKMITGTTQPSTGSIALTGRVAAMLELGMGFHPDFTGRQNVYMAGQLLGLSAEQISSLMQEIEAFAEIGEYIDMPVRVYSSGMQVRLAFSVATAVRPDILIIDEALSVGDAYFQHKSFDRIREFRQQGTTLLLVSHDKQAIQSICDRAILLNHGSIAHQGKPEVVMDYYNALLAQREGHLMEIKQVELDNGLTQTVSGTGEVTVASIALINEKGVPAKTLNVGEKVCLRIEVEVRKNIKTLVLGYGIKDRLGQVMYGTNTAHTRQPVNDLSQGQRLTYDCDFPLNLGPGTYSIQTALVNSDTHLDENYEWRDLALVFQVVNMNKTEFIGSSWLEPKIGISFK